MAIVGVCGYGFSGSSAVVSLLQEYAETSAFKSGRVCEFAFPYEPDGLLDLEYNLVHAPAKHLKGDSAIHRFIQYTKYISKSFDRETDGAFSRLTENYLKEITQVTYKCRRSSDYRYSKLAMFFEKLGRYIQIKAEDRLKRRVVILKEGDRYISVKPEHFVENTKQYVSDILTAAGVTDPSKMAIIDQPFPPNYPDQVFHFFDDPYAIIVDRDPRDIYLTVKNLRFTNGRFVPHDKVEDFITYFKAVSTHREDEDPQRVLRIHFEDLIYDYEHTVERIENFLNIKNHVRMRELFKPELSIKNTQLSAAFPEDKEAIELIEKELKDYLYPFDTGKMPKDRENIFKMASW